MVNPDEKKRTNLILLHLSQFLSWIIPLGGTLVPLVVWLTNKDRDSDYDSHGKSILNFQITMMVIFFAISMAFGMGFGVSTFMELPIVMGVSTGLFGLAAGGMGLYVIVMTVVNAVRCHNGEEPNYWSIKVLK